MRHDIIIKWNFPHPPEKVWKFLTDPELLGQWLMKNDFKPVVGHKFQFHTKPIPKMGFDGIVYCEVMEIVPMRKLVYTWKGGARPGDIRLDTVLTWTLIPQENGTDIILEHTGFRGWKNYLSGIIMGSGWRKHILRRLVGLLNEA